MQAAGTVASVGLAACAVAALAVAGWSAYTFLSGGRPFSDSVGVTLYAGLPAVVAVLLFAALRLGPVHRLRLLIFSVTLAASLYAAELFIDLFQDLPTVPVMNLLWQSSDKTQYAATLHRRFGADIDIRPAREVVADLRKHGVEATPVITPSNQLFIDQPDGTIKSAIAINGREVMPVASVSNTVTVLCNESGQWINYRSDRHGFNNPDGVWQLDHLDIAAVGDSFVHGYCVPPDKNFMALIRQRHNATLNLGIAGDGPLLELATVSEFLPRLRPPVVLWFYYEGNDLTDLQRERRSPLLKKYLTDDFTQPDLARPNAIDRASVAEIPRLTVAERAVERVHQKNTAWRRLRYKLVAFAKLTGVRERMGLVDSGDPDEQRRGADLQTSNMDAFREVLRQAKTRVERWDGQLYFIYLPEWARYNGYMSWGKAHRTDVLSVVRSLDISIIDIDPVFRAHGDPLSLFPFRAQGHYTETGHRLVADEVLRILESAHVSESH
jgi:hypothetical protein